MPSRALACLLMFLEAGIARADILLERFHASGEMPEELGFVATCSMSDTGQLDTEYRAGTSLKSQRTQQLQLTLPQVRASIAEAFKGELQAVVPFPIDGPTLRYRAFRTLADGRRVEVILWEENGGSGSKQINTAPGAARLKRFIDLNCGPVVSLP